MNSNFFVDAVGLCYYTRHRGIFYFAPSQRGLARVLQEDGSLVKNIRVRDLFKKAFLLGRDTHVTGSLARLSESELLQRCILHDNVAWEELLRRHSHVIYYVIEQQLAHAIPSRDGETARDVFGEVLEKLFRNDCAVLRRIRNPVALRAYLLAMARTTAVDYLRRESAAQRAAILQEPCPIDAGPGHDAATREDFERLEKALHELPDREQFLLRLFYEEGMAYKDIAEMTRIPMGTVASVLHRARKTLRELLEQQETQPSHELDHDHG